MMLQRDCHGREIKAGDLIKVPHFIAQRRRKVFMYKLIVRVDDRLRVSESGNELYAVCVVDIAKQSSLDKAHKCRLSVIGDCEIIDGGTVQHNDLFWTRPIEPKLSDTVQEAAR